MSKVTNKCNSIPIYRIAGFYCEHKFLRMIYLGHRRNISDFYIYEYMVWTKLFRARVHLFGVIFLRPLPSLMFVLFTVDSMIRGNHVYKDIWDSRLSEELACRYERNKYPQSFHSCCVKIRRYIPRTILAACYVFLGRLDLKNSFNFIDLLFPLFLADIK